MRVKIVNETANETANALDPLPLNQKKTRTRWSGKLETVNVFSAKNNAARRRVLVVVAIVDRSVLWLAVVSTSNMKMSFRTPSTKHTLTNSS